VDDQGLVLGRDQIPWGLNQHFEIANLAVQRSYVIDSEYDATRCWIRGVLIPALDHRGSRPRYSMLGTKRTIPTIELWIEKFEPDEKFPDKTARASGFMSYTDDDPIWGGKTAPDHLQFNLYFLGDEFREIFNLVDRGGVSAGSLTLRAEGIYSDWTPDITTDQFKVLASDERDQPLQVPPDFSPTPPRLGKVSDVSLSLQQDYDLAAMSSKYKDFDESFSDYDDADLLFDNSQAALAPDTGIIKDQIAELKLILWLIAVLLLLGLFF
jgi:hypothetical protein